ncbi:hypothetical protein K457DRAFT_699015 [Linnemannia elongata AG-77]|uniref:Uncharacterized protein n=1 Tax=Linnemannia elongata AG-77 TaxID=1314771 RepID=A0A197JP89_9FUNG|nr:hypothetical protein K457DRAFT_699015 [Linnemannia elongata AG-77]
MHQEETRVIWRPCQPQQPFASPIMVNQRCSPEQQELLLLHYLSFFCLLHVQRRVSTSRVKAQVILLHHRSSMTSECHVVSHTKKASNLPDPRSFLLFLSFSLIPSFFHCSLLTLSSL